MNVLCVCVCVCVCVCGNAWLDAIITVACSRPRPDLAPFIAAHAMLLQRKSGARPSLNLYAEGQSTPGEIVRCVRGCAGS